MVIGGFILFGMQTAESAPKKLTLRQRTARRAQQLKKNEERFARKQRELELKAIKCAKRAKSAGEISKLTGGKGGCFRGVFMAERRRARAARNRSCGKLSPAAKKACRKRFGVKSSAKARALSRRLGIKVPKKLTVNPLRQRVEKCAKRAKSAKERKSCFRKLRKARVKGRVKDRVRTRVKGRARTRAKGQRAGRPKAKLGCDRFTTERARKTCRGLPAARARAKAAGCSKIRDKDKKSICFRQAKMCGDLRDPKKIAKCRARVTPRHLGRKRCDRIKSLGARAACCAKIRPASRLSPKLCRPVSGPGSVKARVKDRVRTRVKGRVKARARDRARGPSRGRESRARFCGRIISNRPGEAADLRSRCFRRMGRCDKNQNPEKRAKCRARVKARMKGMAKRDAARRACARVPKASRSACLRKAKKRN